MKRARSNDASRQRAVRFVALGMVLCTTAPAFDALAGSVHSAEPSLAPQLVFDADEVAAYVEAFPASDYKIANVPNLGRFYVDDNPALVKKTLLSGRPWEPEIIRVLGRYVAAGDTVLDVGAHIGSLTVAIARLTGPEGRVYAFEPQRKIYRELVHNIKLNELTNVVPLRYAVSWKNRIVEMNPVTKHDGRVQVGKGGDKVEARAIDSFGFSDVSLIKIDVEGYEVFVLLGAEKTITAIHPVIIVEVRTKNRKSVLSFLSNHGYSVQKISSMDYLATYEQNPDR